MKLQKYLITLLLIFILVLVGCESKDTDGEVMKITAEEAKEMMTEDVFILDVREPDEFAQGHVENAKLVPLGVINAEDLTDLPTKDKVILVYCRSGNRSEQAATKLVELGFTKVYDFGGIIDWPYEVVK